MKEKNLVICISEFQYANYLMENIAERKELAVKVYTCTTWEKAELFEKEKKIHILITDETFPRELRKKIEADQMIVLTSGKNIELDSTEKAVYKYQCADQILAEIFEIYFEKTNENVLKTGRRKSRKMVAVYSPLHRSGKTTFAVALGKELAQKEKTLYLNLEEYAGFGERFAKAEGRNLGDILYYVRQEGSNIGIRLNAAAKRMDELDYIPPIPICADLKEVTQEDWKVLLHEIAENSIYETLILDLGESIQGLLQILCLCDKVYMPILEDQISQEKLHQYEENLVRLNMEELLQKTHQFVVPQNVDEYVRRLVREERKT